MQVSPFGLAALEEADLEEGGAADSEATTKVAANSSRAGAGSTSGAEEQEQEGSSTGAHDASQGAPAARDAPIGAHGAHEAQLRAEDAALTSEEALRASHPGPNPRDSLGGGAGVGLPAVVEATDG